MATIRKSLVYCSITAVLGLLTTVYPNKLHTSKEGLRHIASFEQCVSCTYKDHVGVSTIGIGSTRSFDGRSPKPDERLTDEQVALLFGRDIEQAENCVMDKMNGAHMPQSVFDASVSLVYNVGCQGTTWNSKYKRPTNIALQAKARNWPQVCYYMGDFIYAGGKVSNGLKNRRAGDQAICLKDIGNVND